MRHRSTSIPWRDLTLALSCALTLLSGPRALADPEPVETRTVPSAPVSSFLGYVPDQLIVVFTADARHQLVLSREEGRPTVNLPSVQQVLDAMGAISMSREFAGAKPQAQGSRFPDLTGHYMVRLGPGANLDAAVAAFARDPHVDHVEKVGIHTVDATPNDTYYRFGTATFPYDQWHYWDANGVDADLGWDLETGSQSVVVGILDTGVKYRHTDLGGPDPPGPADNLTNGNVWVNAGEIPANGIDDDANGFVDDVVGWDFIDSANLAGASCQDVDCGLVDNDPNDGVDHGTHVAGTVAAITNNARAVAGVAGGFSDGTTSGAGNGCKIMALRIGYRTRVQGQFTGVLSMAWAAQAMNYVATMVDHGVNVTAINCSWGSSNSGGITAAVSNLVAHDVMIFNSAGNSNATTQPYMCTLPGVTAVAATDSNGAKASFSNHGSWVDISAPGDGVLSTYHDPTDPDTTHMYVAILSGTSMSAPHCCGVAALLESYDPSLDRTAKLNLMTSTAFTPPGFPSDMGAGIVNANNALAAAPPVVAVSGPPVSQTRLSLRARPNPARGHLDVLIGGPPGGMLHVDILDMGGRRIRGLESVTGSRVHWDGTDADGRRVTPGLYFAMARSGGATATTKLVMLE
ncbi:MAG TPA: S8 family serine peptidase [Candidatus Eisenbacteria bacterium]